MSNMYTPKRIPLKASISEVSRDRRNSGGTLRQKGTKRRHTES